jgi:HAD superfamily hydrolase (TIGR01484 family)
MKLLFTDIDGTFFDEKYDYGNNFECIHNLLKKYIQTIFISSRTYSELEFLNKQGSLKCDFIGENGNFIYLSTQRKYIRLGIKKDQFREFYYSFKTKFQKYLIDIEDISIRQFAEFSGYSEEEAKRGLDRKYSYLFKFVGDKSQLPYLVDECENNNFKLQFGGKWLSLSSPIDKGVSVEKIKQILNPELTFGIGNSENDESFLRKVDYPYAIINSNNKFCEKLKNIPKIQKINVKAPKGWEVFYRYLLSF